MSEPSTKPKEPCCYRCGQAEQVPSTLRLLPGSNHITLCPECYLIVWGWREKPAGPASGAAPDQHSEGRGRE